MVQIFLPLLTYLGQQLTDRLTEALSTEKSKGFFNCLEEKILVKKREREEKKKASLGLSPFEVLGVYNIRSICM